MLAALLIMIIHKNYDIKVLPHVAMKTNTIVHSPTQNYFVTFRHDDFS